MSDADPHGSGDDRAVTRAGDVRVAAAHGLAEPLAHPLQRARRRHWRP